MNEVAFVISPISPDSPCGPNVYDDRGIDGELQRLVESAMGADQMSAVEGERRDGGKPVGAAAWREVESLALETFRETKHLELAWYFMLSQGHLRGLEGLTDGLDIITQLLTRFPVDLHPLEPEDDFKYRRLSLDRMAEKPVAMVLDLVKITEGRQTGAYSLMDYRKAHLGLGMDPKVLEQSFAETVKEKPSFYEDVSGSADALRAAMIRLEKAAGDRFASYQVPLAELKGKLIELESAIEAFGGPPAESGDSELEMAAPGTRAGATKSDGSLASREDVVRLLTKIIQFYQKFEPTSPVPFMLERASRVVTMDFKEIVGEFNLSGNPSIQEVLGWKNE